MVSDPKTRKFVLSEAYDLQKYAIQVHSNIKGTNQNKIRQAVFYYPALEIHPIPSQSIGKILSKFDFITQTDPNTRLLESGVWDIHDWLSIPEGIKLIISEGTTLQFRSSAGLIAKGPVFINGTIKNPVTLNGLRWDGVTNPTWQGIYITNTKEPSVWSHVSIKNTTGIVREGWSLSAGVTFNQADVVLKNVSFSGNFCEERKQCRKCLGNEPFLRKC